MNAPSPMPEQDGDPMPLAAELPPQIDPVDVFRKLCRLPHCIFFDSALRHAELGCFSFVAADPFDFLSVPADGSDALSLLADRMAIFPAAPRPGLPPFQGGAAGLLGYELALSLERLPRPEIDEFGVPALAVGFYDVVFAFDHRQQRAWIVSTGLPETDSHARHQRAEQRLEVAQDWLASISPEARPAGRSDRPPIPAGQLAARSPEHPSVPGGLLSNFSAAGYQRAVSDVIDYIHAGDAFQVNLSQRLLYPARDDSVALYLRLRERNAATFAGYFDLGKYQICSASPERFLRVLDREVEARPIKGTRARTRQPEADLFTADLLQQSEKDRAENVMIVDLMRNDLARVCRPESVRATQLCGLETYAYVQHLVSVVVGTLRDQVRTWDLLRAAMPGGSVTGAPKIRAMEIIQEMERTARGPYCGSLAYLGFDGTMDASILIRTLTAGAGWWQLPVGGGIVAQSQPEAEYEETWHKAAGMLRALRP